MTKKMQRGHTSPDVVPLEDMNHAEETAVGQPAAKTSPARRGSPKLNVAPGEATSPGDGDASGKERAARKDKLTAAAAQLRKTAAELERANNDLNNLVTGMDVAAVFLDEHLRLRLFTPAVARLFAVIPSDTGRHIGDMAHKFHDVTLPEDAATVQANMTPLARAVPDENGRWFLRNITPYHTGDGRTEGVVVTFTNITDIKTAEVALRAAHEELEMRTAERASEWTASSKALQLEIIDRQRAEHNARMETQRLFDVLETLPIYVILLRPDHHVAFANRFFRERFGEDRSRRCYEYLFDRMEPCETCETYTVLRTGALHHWEWLGPNGRTYDIFDFPFTDADGSSLIMEVGIDITERKEAEADLRKINETLEQRVAKRTEELAASEERLREARVLLEAATEGTRVLIATLDTEYRYTFFNKVHQRGWKRLTGKDTAVGMSLTDLLADLPDLRERAMDLWGRALRGETVVRTVAFGDPGTRQRTYNVRLTPICDPEGRVTGAGEVIVDVTELASVQEALTKGESRFRLLSATAGRLLSADEPQTVMDDLCREVMTHLDCQVFFHFLADEETGRLRLSSYTGISTEEARAAAWLDYDTTVCGCVARERQRFIAEDILHSSDVNTDLLRAYGIQAYCCHPLTSQDRLLGTLSFGTKNRPRFTAEEVELMRMVTDQVAVALQRQQTEAAVRQAKQEWERTFDAVPDLISIVDDRHRIVRVNWAMAKRLELTPDDFTGRLCYEIIHGLDAAPAFCPHALALNDGQEHVTEVRVDSLDGDFLVSATPITDDQGKIIGSVHVARDITKRKKAEESLKERSAELEILNKELESFSYSVSHDLRAPLRAIDGFSRMILKKYGHTFDEEMTRKFGVIRTNTQTMGQLIDALLTLSRLNSKQMSIVKLDMENIVREVWTELQTINPERTMNLTVHAMKPGYGDRTLVKQVYSNLLANAVKFTKYRAAAAIETGSYAEYTEHVYYVKDNGAGFDMAYSDKLFGVFQRLHTVDEFDGTGVGLATVHRIILRHGGRVWAEGTVDEGACFYFSLPVHRKKH